MRTYAHDSIKSVFIWNFDESVISLLPEGDVPYEEVDEQVVYSGSLSENIQKEIGGGEAATKQDGKGKSSLRREYTKLYHFIKGGNDSLSKTRRESMFINLLQVLHPKESEILILTKDKLLTDKYKITFDNVKIVLYPDITWGGLDHDRNRRKEESMAGFEDRNILPERYSCQILQEKTTCCCK